MPTRSKRKNLSIVSTKDFAAEIERDEDGKNRLKILAPTWYRHQLSKFKIGEKVSIYISSIRPKRTLQQNRYYWGIYLPLIAQETGENDIERLHTYFKGKFLTKEIIEVFGEKVRMVKSTTELSKNDFSDYIQKIEEQTGILAPPTANWGLELQLSTR